MLLLSSMTFLSGSEGHNRFSQSMRDTQSKIQDWLNDIPTGYAGATVDTNGITCTSTGGASAHPKFSTGGGPNKGECIFLGKAIQFTDDSTPAAGGQVSNQESQIYSYSVFGLRNYTDPLTGDVRPVNSLVTARPIAAVGIPGYSGGTGSSTDPTDLTEQYTIPGGAKVKKIVKPDSGSVADSHLAGFFLSFNQLSSSSSGSASLRAIQYPINKNRAPGNIKTGNVYKAIAECISLTTSPPDGVDCTVTPPASDPPPLTEWEICFYNDTNSDMALLTISSVGGMSASTKLEFKQC